MKKILLLTSLCLLNLSICSQSKKSEYGIILGLQSSTFIKNNEDPLIYEGKPGYHVGIFISFILNEKISIRPELLYLPEAGSNLKIEGSGSKLNLFNTKNNYEYGGITESLIFLPILTNYKLNYRFSLGIGPVFGYVINRKFDNDDDRFKEFIKNNTSEKFELNLGIHFEYSLNNNIGLFMRYNHGIKERQNLKSSIFQFGLNCKL